MTRQSVNIERELAALRKAGQRVCESKKTARAFLVKHGFLTKRGQLAGRYR